MAVRRIKAIIEIEDDELPRLLTDEGRPPEIPPFRDAEVELPTSWEQVDERHGVTYSWPQGDDVYDPFLVFEGQLSSGPTCLAIGKCERTQVHHQDRVYYIVSAIGRGGGVRPVAEFLATDDYDETGDVIAIIKGKDGTGRQFDDPDELPAAYRPWLTVTYRERVDYPGSYRKVGLVCSELDHETMLNHALAQIQLRKLNA